MNDPSRQAGSTDIQLAPMRALSPPSGPRWVFTDYLRRLDPAGEPRDPGDFDEIWAALRRLLRREIHRRGLWRSPPSFLGVFGWRRWEEKGGQASRGRSSRDQSFRAGGTFDALDELTADCYTFVFVHRLRILRTHLVRKPNIDGLVVRSVRNFLYDIQKRQDPLGFRVFDLVKTAAHRGLQAKQLWIVAGGQTLDRDTVLGCSETADPSCADEIDPSELVRAWNDDLLPDLLTAQGKGKDALVDELCSRMVGLGQQGVEAFRTKAVIDSLKTDARARWAAVLTWDAADVAVEEGHDERTRLVRQIQPDMGFEERQSFDELLACVSQGIEDLHVDKRTRQHLQVLWRYLRTLAIEGSTPASDPPRPPRGNPDGDRTPSRRELSRQLRIPRDRFTDLYDTLGSLLGRCSQSPSG